MQENLVAGEVEQILPAKAKLMAENDGWTLIDVRPYPDYCEAHAWGAKSAQLYVPMEVDSLAKGAKAVASVLLFPSAWARSTSTWCNEDFLDEMQEELEWGAKVILYCATGGVIEIPNSTTPTNGARRSSPRTSWRCGAGARTTSSTWRAGSGCGTRSRGSTSAPCRPSGAGGWKDFN